MASKSPKLTVRKSPNAAADLAQIWLWNAQNYDPRHADQYIKFLQDETDKLETSYARGKRVPSRQEY